MSLFLHCNLFYKNRMLTLQSSCKCPLMPHFYSVQDIGTI